MQYAAEVTQPTPEGTSNGLIQLFGQASVVFVYIMEALKTAEWFVHTCVITGNWIAGHQRNSRHTNERPAENKLRVAAISLRPGSYGALDHDMVKKIERSTEVILMGIATNSSDVRKNVSKPLAKIAILLVVSLGLFWFSEDFPVTRLSSHKVLAGYCG